MVITGTVTACTPDRCSGALGAGPHDVESVTRGAKSCVADGTLQHGLHGSLGARRYDEIIHPSTTHTDQMVVMAHQVLGQLIARPIIAADHLLHDADILENCKIAVHGALRQLRPCLEEIGDRRRPTDRRQQPDQFTPARCVPLLSASQQRTSGLVHTSHLDRRIHWTQAIRKMRTDRNGSVTRSTTCGGRLAVVGPFSQCTFKGPSALGTAEEEALA
jgi:hypothetical protein